MLPAQRYRTPTAGAVLAALHDINTEYGYLPEAELRKISQVLAVPFSQIFSAASFYASFSFKPCGKHKVQVCEGTACYVKGSADLLNKISLLLGIDPEESTEDLEFMLKRVRCVGSCGLAPVIRLDDETFGRVSPEQIESILAEVSK